MTMHDIWTMKNAPLLGWDFLHNLLLKNPPESKHFMQNPNPKQCNADARMLLTFT